jgi:hypothetical protein
MKNIGKPFVSQAVAAELSNLLPTRERPVLSERFAITHWRDILATAQPDALWISPAQTGRTDERFAEPGQRSYTVTEDVAFKFSLAFEDHGGSSSQIIISEKESHVFFYAISLHWWYKPAPMASLPSNDFFGLDHAGSS